MNVNVVGIIVYLPQLSMLLCCKPFQHLHILPAHISLTRARTRIYIEGVYMDSQDWLVDEGECVYTGYSAGIFVKSF